MVTKPELKNKNLIEKKDLGNSNDKEVETEPFTIMEKADEEQVLAELEGNFLEEFVYEFVQNGKKVTGLSLAGVRETVRHMNKNKMAKICISDKEPKIKETEEWIEVWVYAKDEINGTGAWGVKRQQKKYVSGKLNEFALEQALSKAQRNAQRPLIPENYVKSMIRKFIEMGKTRKLTGGKDGKESKPVTEKQLNKYHAMVKEAGLKEDEMDKWVKEQYKVEHKKDLTMAQIDDLYKALDKNIKAKKKAKKITDDFEKHEQGKLKV